MPARQPRTKQHCAVVGAGISGLAAAHRLRERRPDLAVTVLEAAPSIGGKLAQAEVAGLVVDTGAESVLNARPEAVDLIRAVGLAGDLCHPTTSAAWLWSRGRLRPLPASVLGVPVDLPVLARGGVLSPRGVARAGLERLLPGDPPAPGGPPDVSVGSYVTRRLGREVTERLVEPLLGGVYAGHADRLSLPAAAPQVAALAARGGSLLAAAARSRREAAGPAGPLFAGVVGGVGRLPRAVADACGAEVRTSATVRELRRTDRRWELVVAVPGAPTLIEVDAVLLATPAAPTARLLAPVAPGAAEALRGVEAASVAVVTLAMPVVGTAQPPPGSGFLVPPVEGRAVKAVTWSSRKWGWLAGRAGSGTLVLRASYGRAGETAVLQRSDAELIRLATDELAAAVGPVAPPLDARVTRWGGALPQYAVGHHDRVARVRAAVLDLPGLDVCGATYDGVGVAACVADARQAADRLLGHLGERVTMAR